MWVNFIHHIFFIFFYQHNVNLINFPSTWLLVVNIHDSYVLCSVFSPFFGYHNVSFHLIFYSNIHNVAPTLATMPIESNIIKEVIAEHEAMNILENVEIIMRPKVASNTQILRCVGYMEQCGPLYPCCGSNTCTFILSKVGFFCYAWGSRSPNPSLAMLYLKRTLCWWPFLHVK